MRRPLVSIAIFYASGLLVGEFVRPPALQLFALAFTLAAAALLWRQARAWLLIPLLLTTGWANLVSRTSIVSPHDLRVLLPAEPAEITLRGRLTDTPSVRMRVRDGKTTYRTLAQISVDQIQRDGRWIDAYGRLISTTPADLSGLAFGGTRVELRGVVAQPAGPLADGLFDYRSYLAREGIYFELRTEGTNAWRLLAPAAPGPGDRFVAWAKRTLSRGQREPDEPLMLLFAMTLGWRTGLERDAYEPFMQSGTMHIFAISGLHVALIAGILVSLLRLIRIPRPACGLIVVPVLWGYTAATGWQPSAIRSSIMMSVILLGWSIARPADLLNSLAAAALVILAWDPQQLFQASFQLSFCVVLSIALITPGLRRAIEARLAPDPYKLRNSLPRWRRWLNPPLRWLCLMSATSLAAWLGALPLTMHYFHIFSPITLLANVLIVPAGTAALASSLGSLLCGQWLPTLGGWFNHGAWFWMSLMMHISRWSAGLPFAFGYTASPPVWGFAAYYALLIGMASGWFLRPAHRKWGWIALIAAAGAAGWEWQRSQSTIEVTVLPLDGGFAVFVDGPGTRNDWLVDCGDSNAVESITLPFLRAHGVNRLEHLVLTHGDQRHVGGARLIWDAFRVNKTCTSAVAFRSRAYRELAAELAANPTRRLELNASDQAGQWYVLHPEPEDRFAQADDACLVLQGRLYNTRILLLGSLGRPGQEALLQRNPELDSDIVVTGLPEKGEAVCNGLIRSAHPDWLIVADSEFPATKRASRALMHRLSGSGTQAVYTRSQGAITITLRPNSATLRTMSERNSRGLPGLANLPASSRRSDE